MSSKKILYIPDKIWEAPFVCSSLVVLVSSHSREETKKFNMRLISGIFTKWTFITTESERPSASEASVSKSNPFFSERPNSKS